MKDLFLSVVEVSLSTSLVIAVVLALSSLLNRRYAAKWKYFIWLALALRLAVPLSIQLPKQEIVLDVPARMTAPIVFTLENAAPLAVQPQLPRTSKIAPLDIVAWVWLIGAAAFLAMHLTAYFRYRRQILKKGIPQTNEAFLRQLRSLCRELNIRGNIPVMVYEKAASPMVLGFFRPVLVFPEGEYAGENLYFVLKHELIHLKRHDVFGKFLLVLASAVHWFNPLVYLMQRQAVVDMELSCDERVVQGTPFQARRAYTETLLSTISRRYQKTTKFSTQFYGGKNVMKKRFQNILNRAKKKSGWLVLSIAVVVVIILGTIIGLRAPDPQDPTPVGDDIFYVARDFAVAYASGDLETMKLFLDESYSGPVEAHPSPESDPEKAGRMFNGQEDYRQPGDIFNNSGLSPSLFDKTVPVGSTYTVLMRESGRTDGDHLIISLINREDGWKVRDYRFEKGTAETILSRGTVHGGSVSIRKEPDIMAEKIGSLGDGDWIEILEIKGNWYRIADGWIQMEYVNLDNLDTSVDPEHREQIAAGKVASQFARARFQNDLHAMLPYMVNTWEGFFWDITFDGTPVISEQVKALQRPGDISLVSTDPISLASKNIPVGSTTTMSIGVKDDKDEDNLIVCLIREEEGWKVYDFGYEIYEGFLQKQEEAAPPVEDTDLENVPESEPAPMPTEATGAPDTTEMQAAGKVAFKFAMACFRNDTATMRELLGYEHDAALWTYSLPEGSIDAEVQMIALQEEGDISVKSSDPISIYSNPVPEGSTITMGLPLKDRTDYFLVSLIRQEDGWKVMDYKFSESVPREESEALQLYTTAGLFINGYFEGDTEKMRSCLVDPNRCDGGYTGSGVVDINAFKNLPVDGLFQPRNNGSLEVSLEFAEKDSPDSYTYLTMSFIQKDGQWLIDWYGLEK